MGKRKTDEGFLREIANAGGEVLAPTNSYEVMRFKTKHGVGVVYVNAKGERTWNAEALKARDHLAANDGAMAPVPIRRRKSVGGRVPRLLERDGEGCFFCRTALGEDITVEHLVPRAHGGPDHISNLFLAHFQCNADAGHLSAPEKIAIREKALTNTFPAPPSTGAPE